VTYVGRATVIGRENGGGRIGCANRRFSVLIRRFGSNALIRWEFDRSLNYRRRFSDLILSQDRCEHAWDNITKFRIQPIPTNATSSHGDSDFTAKDWSARV
jgi:hypothetical protein